MLRKLLFAGLLALSASPALAQTNVLLNFKTSATASTQVSATNPLPVDATVTATVGGFAPNGNFDTITATDSSDSATLPTGEVVLFQNTGTTAVSCTLGSGSATALASENIIQPGSTIALTVGSNDTGACIDQTGSTSNTVVLSGGAGIFTGMGGGSGGGGGAVTLASGAVSSGAYSSGSIASGAFASGAISSGAVASGAFASGSIASGAIAAGAQVDLLTMRGSKNAGTAAANSLLIGTVYNSTPPTLTDTQQASLQSDANGFLKVNVAAGSAANAAASATGSGVPADAGYTGLNSSGTLVGWIGDVTHGGFVQANSGAFASGSIASGAIASGAVASGAVASGAYAAGSIASGAAVDGWNVTLGATDDAACGSADGTCSEIALLKFLNTAATGSIPAGSNLIGSVGIDQTTDGTTNLVAAHGSVASGATADTKPVGIGGIGLSAEPAAVDTGDAVRTWHDLSGKPVTSPYAARELFLSGSGSQTIGATATAFTGIGAQGTGKKVYGTDIQCGRTDTGTSAITVSFNDAASTVLILPNNGGGGGNNVSLKIPLVFGANDTPTFTLSDTVITAYCNMQGFSGY